ncbi:MAG: antA/AntB antirepressor family protein [Lachnospiraceae bacterium]
MIIIANEMIPVYDNDGEQAVNTRELHEFLEVASRYNDWIKNRIDKNGYQENDDYQAFTKNLVSGGCQTDYIVPIDIAKEIAMMENNDKGRQVRRYFIEVEKRYRQQVKPMSQLEILAATTQALVDQDHRVRAIESRMTNAENKQKAMIDAITDLAQLDWAADMNRRINGICKTHGLNYQTFRSDIYFTLETTAHCDLTARKRNLQVRMKQSGAKYREVHGINKLQVIADDPKLRAIFEGIVRTQQFKYAGKEDQEAEAI